MRLIFPFAALLAALFLSSCASLSKEECVVADWQSIGERDGAAGKGLNYFSRHVDACKKTVAKPDQAKWQAGHSYGAQRYCTPQNGLQAGNAGKTYNNICQPRQQRGFLAAFELGKERYNLLSQRSSLVRELEGNRSEIDRIKRKVKKKKLDINKHRPTFRILRRKNRRILDDIEDIDYRIARLDRHIAQEGYEPLARPVPIY
ncbi:MAG: DUF2799 domain-containing protein [Rhizobiaceae bacterium]